MDASRALRAVTIFLFVGLAVRPAGAQFNFGGGCDFDLWPSGNTLTLPSCSKYPGRPGSETQTWDYICSQGNDCAESTNRLQEPFESRGSLRLTLAGACGSSVSDTYCPYQWDYVRQGELWFEASGRDGQLQTVPVPPFGVEFELICALHSPTITSTSCTYCGHPCEEPLIISLEDQRYELTDTRGGVWFDLSGDGQLQRIPWTARHSDDAFLVLDRNANGTVDDGSELFSHVSPQPLPDADEVPHGFRAPAVYDDEDNGGNADGQISPADAIFSHLRLWRDSDHDGQTDIGELQSLGGAEVRAIDLDYTNDNEHRDSHGNLFKFSAPTRFAGGRSVDAWVVYFNLETCPACTEDGPGRIPGLP